MFNPSNSPAGTAWPTPGRAPGLGEDALYFLVLRYVAHLPYFKIASALLLPQGMSTAGVLVTTLVYALACSVASRWIAGLRREDPIFPNPAVLPLLGATAVLIAMMVMGPAIATVLPRHPGLATGTLALLPAWLALLAPVIAGFFLAQFLTRPRPRQAFPA